MSVRSAEPYIGEQVTIEGHQTAWHGKLVGVVDEPCYLIELEDGSRVAVAASRVKSLNFTYSEWPVHES